MKKKLIKSNVLKLFLVVLSIAGVIKVGLAIAQTEATSTESAPSGEVVTAPAPATTTEPAAVTLEESSTTTESTSGPATTETPFDRASSTTTTESSTLVAENQTTAPTPQSVSLSNFQRVNIVGTKYIDYFTDGNSEYSFPSDPAIVEGFSRPNSAVPTHGNLTWTGTRGYVAYDTSSGDLEEGQYAEQSDGTFVVHYPAMIYTSATSTSKQFSSQVITTNVDPSTRTLEGFTVSAQ